MKKDNIRLGVIELLKEDERCRNDDKWLIWRFMRDKAQIKMYIPFTDFERMPSFESIRRIRAHIQNRENKLLPTDPNVRIKRKVNENEWRLWLKKADLWGVER